MTRLIQFCLLAVVIATTVAGLRLSRHSGMTVDDVDLGIVKLHEPIWVNVSVISHSFQPIRLLGVTSSCGPDGCVLESEFPSLVEPFGTAIMEVQFRPEQSGVFERRVEFFADGTSHYRNEFRIRGTGRSEDDNQTGAK
jgi:hypothetical protein